MDGGAEAPPPQQPQPDEASEGSDDLGVLISFQNLESVVRHIIRKFKTMEAVNEHVEAEIRGVRSDLQARATKDALIDLQADLSARIESFSKSVSLQKDSLQAMESQFERSRVMCGAIEKKIEACVKEKAVQDRLLRETQDSLQDKVAVAELNMFEAKFAGYTTKLEYQDLSNRLHDYARLDVTERMQESMKLVMNRFDDYTRTAKVGQLLQELRDWAQSEFQQLKSRDTWEKLEEVQATIRDQSVSFERSHSAVDDKLRGLSDRVTSIYAELINDLHQRAVASDLDEVRGGLKKYALKADVQAFQQDCIPKLRLCVESLKAFDDRLHAQDDAIQRMDEVLLDKAAKYDLVVMSAKVDQCMPREEGAREMGRLSDEVSSMHGRLEGYIEQEAERLKACRPPDIAPLFEEMKTKICLKADKADLIEMHALKANRIDADELAKLQDIIHRQLEYLAVTSFGLSKLVLTDTRPGESKTLRTQQKAQVLMQSEALWTWILHNEPPPNLDTLKPPPWRVRNGTAAERPGRGDAVGREKRELDDAKRAALECKLAASAGGTRDEN